MPITREHPLILQLIKAFGIPKDCTKFTINASLGDVVTVDCQFYPKDNGGIKQLKKYRLEELNNE